MKIICATLMFYCNIPIYGDQSEFIKEIGECSIEYNANYAEPAMRIPIKLVIAIAAHETGWGTSRFAKQGNNYFGIQLKYRKDYDPDNYLKPKANNKVLIKKYINTCESVNDFMDIMSQSKLYMGFQKQLLIQWVTDELSYIKLIENMTRYSHDKNWEYNTTRIINSME